MKIKLFALLLFCAVSLQAQTNLTYIDVSSVSNIPTSGFGLITVTNKGWTNEAYTVTNPAALRVGEAIGVAFAKANTNFAYLQNYYGSNYNYLITLITNKYERSGEVTIASLATTTTVTLYPSYPPGVTNYAVLLTCSGFATFPSAMYSNRQTNSFDINTASIAGGGKVSYWTKP